MEPVKGAVYNEDTQNGLRLTVLLCDLGGEILREKFHDCGFSKDPKLLYDQLAKHKETLKKLRQSKILNVKSSDLLFPNSNEPDTRKWDITLLSTLLRHVSGIKYPFNCWNTELEEEDRSDWANIVRLHKYRNVFYGHRPSTSVSSSEFRELWDKVERVLLELGTPKDKINEAKEATLDQKTVAHLKMLESKSAEQIRNVEERMFSLENEQEQTKMNVQNISSDVKNIREEIGKQTKVESLSTDQCDQIISELKQYYKSEKSAPREEWDPIEDVRDFSKLYIQLEMIHELVHPASGEESCGDTKGYISDSKESSEIYDVFNRHQKSKTPFRVVITGPAGMGKTTLCQKLVFDYAHSEAKFSSRFSDVEFLFFVRCCKLEKTMSISDVVIDLIEELDRDLKERLVLYLKQNGEKVLFLIDGLDELVDRNKDLDKLLNGQLFKKSRIIVTTRNEGLTPKRKQCFHSSFKIAELKDDDIKSFVNKHLKAGERNKLISEISPRRPLLVDLSKNPLNLYLICLLWQEDDKEGLPEKQSELYNELVYSFARRLASKRDIDNFTDEDIFVSLLLPLSTLAYNSLKKHELYFDHSELKKVWKKQEVDKGLKMEDIIKLGLVSTTKGPMEKLTPSIRYEFVHKSYQEFLCALFVNHQFSSVGNDEAKDLLLKEYAWLLDVDWRQQSVNFFNQLPVQFLLGISREEDTRLILSNVLKAIRILTLNGHTCEGVFQCFKDISSDVFSRISTQLVRVMPEDVVVTSTFEQSTMLDILESACRIEDSESTMVKERDWKVKCVQLNNLSGFSLQRHLAVINKIISRDLCQLECLQINSDASSSFSESSEFTELIRTWQKSKSLHSLGISLNLSSDLGSVLEECLKHSNKGTVCQKHLTVTGCNKPDPSSSSRENCLSKFLGKCNILKSLSLKNMFIPKAVAASILEGISQNGTLQELNLSNNNIDESIDLDFHKMLKMNNTLKVLNLKGNKGIGDKMANSIASALKENSCLTSLDLSENSITRLGLLALREMISVNNAITTFHVGPIPGEDQSGCRSLCKAFGNRDASSTSLILGSWIIRAPLLLSRDPPFRLPLKIINLSHEEISESKLPLLLTFVSTTTTLTSLKLEEAGIGDGVMLEFGKALSQNRSLVSLDISRNNVTGRGMECLLQGLTFTGEDPVEDLPSKIQILNLTVDKLDVSYNRLGETGAFRFFDAFSETKDLKLKEVNLAGNGITNRGIDPFIKTLHHGTSLVALDLSHNLLTWNTLKKIPDNLQHSKSLKVLNLSGNIGVRSDQVKLKKFLMTTVTLYKDTDIICSPFKKPKARITNDLRNLACLIPKENIDLIDTYGLSSACKRPRRAICAVPETDLENIDLVLIVDCSSSTTNHIVWRVQRALRDFVKQSWDGYLGSKAHVAVLRCTVWSTKSSVLCSGLKTTRDAVKQEMKKVRSESMHHKTNQKPIDTATLLEAFRKAERLEFRKNSTRICIYIGELPYDFPEAESADDLYMTFRNLVQKQIFTYCVLRGELDQDLKFSHKLVPGLLLRSLVLRTGGDFLTLNKWIAKKIKKTLDRFVCDVIQISKARFMIIEPVTEAIANAGREGLSTQQIQQIFKENYSKKPKQEPKKTKQSINAGKPMSMAALLKYIEGLTVEIEDETETTVNEQSRLIHEYISLTQKIAWSQISLQDAFAELRKWSRKLVKDADLETILSQTADILQRIQLTLFRLLQEAGDEANVGQDGISKVVCPVALRSKRDIRCYWNDSVVKFYCYS